MLFVVVTVTVAGEAKDLIAADNSAVQKAEKEFFTFGFRCGTIFLKWYLI